MYSLIKFFSNPDYAEQFKKGHLYLNSLSFFKKSNYLVGTPLNKLAKMNSLFDYREGAALVLKNKVFKTMLPEDFREFITLDPIIDLLEYEYSHLLCFYRLDISIIGNNMLYMSLPPLKAMEDFGNTVAIITDTEKFMDRVKSRISSLSNSLIYNMGNVRYKNPSIDCEVLNKNDKRLPRNSLVFHVVKHDNASGLEYPVININDFIKNIDQSDIIYRDCFVKNIQYECQQEWRICLYDSKSNFLHTKEPVVIDVGDLSDIVQICNIHELDPFMEHIGTSDNYFPINAPEELLFGNISRKNFLSTVIGQNPYGTIYFDLY